MEKLKGKVAIVTGAGSGIGLAAAEESAREGASVYCLDIRFAEHATISQIHCDVSRQQDTLEAIETVWNREGRIDILVNNAGVSHIGTATSTTEEDFDRLFRVNVKGMYNCLHGCLPRMKESGGGVVVNLSSIAAEVGLADRFAYSMTKGAVSAMTLSVARDYIGDRIRCVGIAPARVHTPFVDDFLRLNYPGREQEMYDMLAKSQPVGRMGKPAEIARLIVFLCSEEASFITGSIIPIDGGFITLKI